MTTQKPVLISGAGLASLLLAQSLRRSSIPFLVFESDSSISFRAQGYRLRLSSEGLDAIEAVLGPEKFPEFWDTCSKTGGGGFGSIDAITGEKIPDEPKSETAANIADQRPKIPPEPLVSRQGKIVGISRGDMRRLFLSGCEDHVRWSHRVTGYQATSSGVHAIFADGSKSEEGQLLVGGDGIHSKITKQLSGGILKVYDTGARGIHGQAPTTAFKALGEGVWRITDDSNPNGRLSIITNVRPGDMDDPNVQFGWTMAGTPGVIQAPNDNYALVGPPAAKLAKDLTTNWHPRVKSLVDNIVEAEAAFWKITCSSPTGVPEWENNPRVTLIGDAVHSMTPAGGIGANTAVRDSALLGRLLATKTGEGVDGVTEAYEKEMRVYGSEAVGASYRQAHLAFGVTIDEQTRLI